MDLQTAFYIVGIVFMGLMLLLFVVLITAVFVIRAKVNAIHRQVDQRFGDAVQIIESGAKIVSSVKRVAGK